MCRTTCKVDLHDLFKTHMHQLEIHIPFTWRLCHPRNNIAEQEESDWYYDRFIRQQRTFGGDGTTRQIAVGQYCKKQVKEHIGDSPADLASLLTRSNKPLFASTRTQWSSHISFGAFVTIWTVLGTRYWITAPFGSLRERRRPILLSPVFTPNNPSNRKWTQCGDETRRVTPRTFLCQD